VARSGGEPLYGELTMLGCEQLFRRIGLSGIYQNVPRQCHFCHWTKRRLRR